MIHTIKDVEINKKVPLFTPATTEGYEDKPVLVGAVSTEQIVHVHQKER